MGETVWLVGMMGAGKSATGRALALRLGKPFVDTDDEIERRHGRTVSEIFEREGEARFREWEREAIEALRGKPLVVALGGGAIAQPGAPESLSSSGSVVYLRARPETLLARLAGAADRPLLAGAGPEERLARVKELLAERESAYATAAITLDTDDLPVEGAAEELLRRLAPTPASAAPDGGEVP